MTIKNGGIRNDDKLRPRLEMQVDYSMNMTQKWSVKSFILSKCKPIYVNSLITQS